MGSGYVARVLEHLYMDRGMYMRAADLRSWIGSRNQAKWLVTGAAGFIGSNLVEALVKAGQIVVGLDNFATGHSRNIEQIRSSVGREIDSSFEFVEGDICDLDVCMSACAGVDYVLHQAALGSVPRSIGNPLKSHSANVNGFVNMLCAARKSKVKKFVYASSSSVYGDSPALPKVEKNIGMPLSPYAVTKRVDELYAKTFRDHYTLQSVGLRYFNVFGRRQDPDGAYAAVIPKWIGKLLAGETPVIYGDGGTSRDFCYIDNVIQANVKAAINSSEESGAVYNIACGERTTLNELYKIIVHSLERETGNIMPSPQHGPFRAGDVRHSLADISRAHNQLGYVPTHSLAVGLEEAIGWYVENLS